MNAVMDITLSKWNTLNITFNPLSIEKLAAFLRQSAAARGPHPYSLAQLALKRLRQGPQATFLLRAKV